MIHSFHKGRVSYLENGLTMNTNINCIMIHWHFLTNLIRVINSRMFYIIKCIFMKSVFIIKQHLKHLTSRSCDIKHIPKDLCQKRNYPLKPLTFTCLFKISQKMSKITFKLLNSLNMAK